MTNGDIYKGDFMLDKKHGRGEMLWKDKSHYIGDWNNNTIHGIGKMYLIDKQLWVEGEFENNVLIRQIRI